MSNYKLNAHTDYEKKLYGHNIRVHNLGSLERVWVIGSVRGKAEQFETICKQVLDKSKIKDRLVFTGNLIGNNKSKINSECSYLILTQDILSNSQILRANCQAYFFEKFELESMPIKYYQDIDYNSHPELKSLKKN